MYQTNHFYIAIQLCIAFFRYCDEVITAMQCGLVFFSCNTQCFSFHGHRAAFCALHPRYVSEMVSEPFPDLECDPDDEEKKACTHIINRATSVTVLAVMPLFAFETD